MFDPESILTLLSVSDTLLCFREDTITEGRFPALAIPGNRTAAKRGSRKLSFRQKLFLETRLPVYPVIGNSEGIRRAGALETPAL